MYQPALDGETVFGRVETTDGRKSIFEIVEGVMGSIDPFVKSMKWLLLREKQG